MQAKRSLRNRSQRKNKKRILKFVSALIVVLIALAVFLVPAFVSSEKGRKIILTKINNSIDGKTDFAGLSMSWWRGIKVTDFSFNDSADLTFVKIKQITTKPHYGSILLGSLSFGKTIIDEPKVKINLKHPSPARAEGSRQEVSAGKRAQPIILPIKKIDLVVNDGNLKVTDPQAGTVDLAQINSKVNLRPSGQQTSFDIDMAVVKKGKESKIRADGQIIAKEQTGWTFKGTSGDLTAEVNDLDLGSLGPLLAWAGVELDAEGKVSADIKSEIKDGRLENLSADIKAEKLDITGPLLKGDRLKTNTLDVQAKLVRQQKMIHVENLDITADWL